MLIYLWYILWKSSQACGLYILLLLSCSLDPSTNSETANPNIYKFFPPVDLYLIFEKSSCKIKFDKLDFQPAKTNFEIDFCRLHRGDFSEIKYRWTGGRGCLPGQIQSCRLTIKNSLQSIDVGDLCKNVENEDLIDCTDRPKVVQICANRCVLSGSE